MSGANHSGGQGGGGGARPRCAAVVGPYGSGKSTLVDALLAAAGSPPPRRAAGGAGRGAANELRVVHCTFMDDPWAILDCPGSVEFAYHGACALSVADMAVLVVEPIPDRALAAAPLFKALEEGGVPTILFVNKIDTLGEGRVRDLLAALQAHSRRPLVLRQVPIRDAGNDGGGGGLADAAVTGYVDLVSERAYRYRRGQPSELVAMPATVQEREAEARAALCEALADHDDALLEKILEDAVPTPQDLYRTLRKEEARGAVVEVLLGAGDRDHGVRRLWKALRHDAPHPAQTAERRLGIEAPEDGSGPLLAQVFKTLHAGQGGKLSYARIWRGALRDGATLGSGGGGLRAVGLTRFPGGEPGKVPEAGPGDVVAIGRLDGVATGATIGGAEGDGPFAFPAPPEPVYAMAIATEDRKDDVRLSGALQRLVEEDPSLRVAHDPETGQMVLSGQGDLHLGAALERLATAYNVKVSTVRPRVAYKEAIRGAVRQHARLKRQTGGHGQFADVVLEIAPRARGEGFSFTDRIVGGAVPKRFIPAVGEAAEEATRKGPLGNPVVDIAVTLVDGTFHSVDSSDMAFSTATRMAMQEGLAKADPVVLEPIDRVSVTVPQDLTSSAQRLLTQRRGQILGYAEKEGWPGWDEVEALVPQAELHDLIIELRSQTLGLGTYRRRFDHLAEVRSGR